MRLIPRHHVESRNPDVVSVGVTNNRLMHVILRATRLSGTPPERLTSIINTEAGERTRVGGEGVTVMTAALNNNNCYAARSGNKIFVKTFQSEHDSRPVTGTIELSYEDESIQDTQFLHWVSDDILLYVLEQHSRYKFYFWDTSSPLVEPVLKWITRTLNLGGTAAVLTDMISRCHPMENFASSRATTMGCCFSQAVLVMVMMAI